MGEDGDSAGLARVRDPDPAGPELQRDPHPEEPRRRDLTDEDQPEEDLAQREPGVDEVTGEPLRRTGIAGRQVPLTGGMFLCRGERAAVEAWAATDPFAVHGLAEYRFIEVAPSVVAPGLESLKG